MFTGDKPCYLQPLVNIANKSLYFGTNFKVIIQFYFSILIG